MRNAIEVKGLTKSYKDFCLQDVTLALPSGSILGLVGENGAGKTTLIQLIMNTLGRDAGEIAVLGEDNQSPEFLEVKEQIGIVLDEAYFPQILTAKNVNRLLKYSYKNWQEEQFYSYLHRFGLPENKPFKDFSRGMKMKLAIATALSHQPKLLILDEATSGLDPLIRDEIVDLFYDFTREEDHSVLISSHIVSDLEKICDYIAFLHKGRLILMEEKDKLLEDYAVVRATSEQLVKIEARKILGRKKADHWTDCLMKRENVPQGLEPERTTIEEIILLMGREAQTK